MKPPKPPRPAGPPLIGTGAAKGPQALVIVEVVTTTSLTVLGRGVMVEVLVIVPPFTTTV
jgi:hypothetical protein